MSGEEEQEREKEPWVWKAAIVFLPVGLAVSAAIAMWMKVSGGANDEMLKLNYLASDFDSKALDDSVSKLEDLVGERGYVGEEAQLGLRRAAALIEGTLGPNNLGYGIENDEGVSREGRIWKNYWIDSNKNHDGKGTVLIWANYSQLEESGSVAALLSVAEWMRGRTFEKHIRLAFLLGESEIPVATADLRENKEQTLIQLEGLGMGSRDLVLQPSSGQKGNAASSYRLVGEQAQSVQTDWKLTTSWEYFEEQVRGVCEKISEEAGEKIVFEP